MQGELQFQKDSRRLTLARKFDKAAQQVFESNIAELLASGHTQLELNLHLVEFISSSGLGQIAMTCFDLKAKGIQVSIVGIQPKIQGMLDRHGLSELFATA